MRWRTSLETESNNRSEREGGYFRLRILTALLLCSAACAITTATLLAFVRPGAPAKVSHRTLTFADRVAYQRAIEDVYWRHRIWPAERPDPKEIQSWHRQLDSHQHNQRARWPTGASGSLDRQRDDRVGRI